MSYCVNCGELYHEPVSLCHKCSSDPRIPKAIVKQEAARGGWRSDDPAFGYPGEGAALALSVAVALAVAIVLGTVSFGLFLVLLALSLVNLKLTQVSYMKNMMPASARSFPVVARIAEVAAYRLKVRCPEVYVGQDPTYNAFTLGFGRHGFIVVNSSLVQDFEPAELLFVIGHEMGHIKRFHTTWLTLVDRTGAGGARFLLAPAMRLIFNVWGVKSEYSADQAGLIACGDVDTACSALVKLGAGPGAGKAVDLGAFREAKGHDTELGGLLEYLGDHPFIQNRVQGLLSYAASRDYGKACWWQPPRT